MWQMLWQLSVVGAAAAYMEVDTGHGKGDVFPRPQYQRFSRVYWTLSEGLKFEVVTFSCDIIRRAIHRRDRGLARLLKLASSSESRTPSMPALKALTVRLLKPCEMTPSLHMDEYCEFQAIELATDELHLSRLDTEAATLTASSVWGILHGLETFGQLFYFSNDWSEVRINATIIKDKPLYSHRGLLLDSARHFLPPRTIHRTLAAMAHSKLNVLHWHLTDDESFPIFTRRVPQLAELGAFHPSAIYWPKDIRAIVRYATDRGIRILPELDVPGHTRSWAKAFPQVMTQCDRNSSLDPTKNETYDLIQDLLQDFYDLFPDKFVHLGGDETDFDCWNRDENVHNLKIRLNFKIHVLKYFMNGTFKQLPPDRDAIVWEDVYTHAGSLPRNTIVQMWNNVASLEMILKDGLRAVYSSSWYLDGPLIPQSWYRLYDFEPRSGIAPNLTSSILGGEACMWGEGVDESNLDSRVWPRASVVAEVLWSGALPNSGINQTARVAEHICRLRRLGVDATPTGPGFCLY